ncbi:MAG TPA: GAF domain-containing protein [Jatrophihabitans sp.]|jgi:hypothetical protein|nr:GAF domain-containing protein [Jatrophihabitans sp.]
MPALQDWGGVLAALRDGAAAELLSQTLALGHDVAEGTVGCSLTELDGVHYQSPAASTELALVLDEAQYEDAAGPCVNAARDHQPQRIDIMVAETRFPRFVAAASRHGVQSSLSVPITGRYRPTALNLYSTVESAFTSDRAWAIAGLLSRMVAAASPIRSAASSADQAARELARAREQGDWVNAAVEKVMRQSDLDRAAAFANLTQRSRTGQTSLSRIADEVLNGGRTDQ